jgi:hypothetical protein
MPSFVWFVAMAVRVATASLSGRDRARPNVAQLENLLEQAGALLLQIL